MKGKTIAGVWKNFNKPLVLSILFMFCIFYFNQLVESEENPVNDFIILHQLYGQKKLVVEFDFKNKINIIPEDEVNVELISEKIGLIEKRKIKPVYFKPENGKFYASFDMKKLSHGVYQIKANVIGEYGDKVIDKLIKEFTWNSKELEQFKWLDSKEGITNEVLAPWTPIEVEQKGKSLNVKVWGRAYHFKESPFPTSIETKGNSILAKPIQIIAKVDGKTISWKLKSFKINKRTSGIVNFSQEASGGGLNLSAVTQIEYDGMILIDWKIIPNQSLELEELTVEIPIDNKYAEYMYTSGFLDRVGFVPKEGYLQSFTPMLWLGNDECGLEWFCESGTKDWYNVNLYQQIEILSEEKEKKLRLHIIDEPIKMEPGVRVKHELGIPVMAPADKVVELSYTFGLQATPVKPMKEDVWDYRFIHTGAGNDGIPATPGSDDRFNIPESALNSWVNSGGRTIAMHSQWTDYAGYTSTPYPEALKRCVKVLHERGMKMLLYLYVSMSSIVPEWSFFNEECVVKPLSNTPWDKVYYPTQDAYSVCNNSVNQDLLVYGISQMIDEYDIDGVYLDGTALTWGGCKNTLHGCGYMRSDGKLSKTFPIFANRELMRRMYTVVKKRKPDGHVNFHNSTEMLAPVLSWVTSYWNGEQFSGRLLHAGISRTEPTLEKISLDHFRAEFMGIQWGIPAEFLPYTLIKVDGPEREVLPLALLHDVPLRGDLMSPIWKLMDEFKRKESEWLPYWKNKEYVTVNPDNVNVYVSLYKHPKNGVLAVVCNLSAKLETVKVKLNLKNLKLKDKLFAYDSLLLYADVNITDGEFELSLPPGIDGLKIIWVKEDEL